MPPYLFPILGVGPLCQLQCACSMSNYINGDNELQVCADLDDDHWEDSFMESLTQQEATPAAEDSDPGDDIDVPPPVPKIKDFKEAVQTREDLQNFLESRNCLEMAAKTNTLINEVAAYQASTMRQTTLTHSLPRNKDIV